MTAVLEWPRVWSQENLYLPKPDGLPSPAFCLPSVLFLVGENCILGEYTDTGALVQAERAARGQVWWQDGVLPASHSVLPRTPGGGS